MTRVERAGGPGGAGPPVVSCNQVFGFGSLGRGSVRRTGGGRRGSPGLPPSSPSMRGGGGKFRRSPHISGARTRPKSSTTPGRRFDFGREGTASASSRRPAVNDAAAVPRRHDRGGLPRPPTFHVAADAFVHGNHPDPDGRHPRSAPPRRGGRTRRRRPGRRPRRLFIATARNRDPLLISRKLRNRHDGPLKSSQPNTYLGTPRRVSEMSCRLI